MTHDKLRPCLAALALAGFSLAAHAEFKDGNKLLAEMNGSAIMQMGALGYVIGVSDALNGAVACPPANVTAGQVFDMVKQYLEENPAQRHFTGDFLIGRVLSRPWPCKQQPRGNGV